MTETNHDGFWSAIEALGGQHVPPSLQAAVAKTKEDVKQLEFKFDAEVAKAEAKPIVAKAEAKAVAKGVADAQ